MSQATMVLNPAFRVGPANRRIFGTFVEHMGRCVYTGIYEPEHPTADEHGFRQDVAELVRELGATVVRYPGGNFVSNYRWEDGVGPKEERPRRVDLAWRSIEPNQVGTDDFLAWCKRMEIEPMLAVNLGTRGLEDAIDYLQYVNGDAGTEPADWRVRNGVSEPWDVRVWCLGNEMDGPWQIGHKTAEEYGRLAEEVANAFVRLDPTLDLVACGSSNRSMPTFGEWERAVLERTFDLVGHVSAHAYYEPIDGDVASFLASAEDMHRFIGSVVATADHVAALRRSEKRIMVSFDEWNVWYIRGAEHVDDNTAPIVEARVLIEDTYSAIDAVVVGSLLITLLRHTDRVSMACQAQLVNVIAPIRTDAGGSAWRQTIFHPFALTARHAVGEVLQVAIDGPTVSTPAFGDVEQVWSTATWDESSGSIALFLVNRSLEEAATVTIELDAFGHPELVEHLMIHETDHDLTNTAEHPDRVVPREGTSSVDGGTVTVELPAVSWHCVRLVVS